MKKKIFYLIGFMGAGKTTLGKQIAGRLGFHFQDLDAFLEAQTGRSVRQIFVEEGETAFRAKERQALQELIRSSPTPLILACGGGAPCYENNLALMQQNGFLIYLKAEPSTLMQRLAPQKDKRPLVKDIPKSELLNHIQLMLQSRNPYYWQADFVFTVEKDKTEVLLKFIEVCAGT
jgi:shikimate kinase